MVERIEIRVGHSAGILKLVERLAVEDTAQTIADRRRANAEWASVQVAPARTNLVRIYPVPRERRAGS